MGSYEPIEGDGSFCDLLIYKKLKKIVIWGRLMNGFLYEDYK